MNQNRAAIRYSKATLDLAMEKKAVDQVEQDMRLIASTLKESLELTQLLESPVVKLETKKQALSKIFEGSHPITLGLINTLADNKRIDMLDEVALKYMIQYKKLKDQEEATVTTAVPLSAALEKQILAKVESLTGKKVSLKNIIDENLVGGFVLRVGDLQYDASLANKLNTLKREFTNSL